MGYQTAVNVIRAAAQAVNPDGFFVHGRRSDGSIEYNEAFPQIHLYPFTSSANITDTWQDGFDIVLGFWQQDSPDSTPEEREAIIAEMDGLMRAFVAELRDNPLIGLDALTTEPQYRTLSGTLSGYACRFRMLIVNAPC
jgi:hypothetical protein